MRKFVINLNEKKKWRLRRFVHFNFLNRPTPASFIVYFRSFQTNIITIFTATISEKCLSSIRCRYTNPQPLEHESPPITTIEISMSSSLSLDRPSIEFNANTSLCPCTIFSLLPTAF